jgi:hypothetical protein
VPGYRSERPGAPAGRGAGPAASGAGWPGPALGDAAGRGPVRGFPPAPGQAPPLYPPGQFAAWNRADGSATDGHVADGGVAVASPDSAWPAPPGSDWGQDLPWPADDAPPAGGPADDGTSTGTWPTHSDGAGDAWGDSNGTPAGPQTAQPAARDGLAAAAADWPDGTAPGRPGGATTAIPAGGPGPAAPAAAGPPPAFAGAAPPKPGRKGSGRKGSAPPRGSTPSGPAAQRPGAQRPAAKRKGRSSAALAVTAVGVVAVAAAGFLLYTASHQNNPPATLPPPKAHKHPTASASPTPTPTNHILTRTADPLPLSVAQLFPARFIASGHPFLRTASKSQSKCPPAIVGARLQKAVKAAKCTQVLRASYVSFSIKVMGTIGVLNLSTSQKAEHAGLAVDRSDFIALLKGRRGVTRGLGRGTGIVEADVKGHYLILMWAQFTTHHPPRKATQKTRLENFMKDLFEQTANVSLTKRMVDGTP